MSCFYGMMKLCSFNDIQWNSMVSGYLEVSLIEIVAFVSTSRHGSVLGVRDFFSVVMVTTVRDLFLGVKKEVLMKIWTHPNVQFFLFGFSWFLGSMLSGNLNYWNKILSSVMDLHNFWCNDRIYPLSQLIFFLQPPTQCPSVPGAPLLKVLKGLNFKTLYLRYFLSET